MLNFGIATVLFDHPKWIIKVQQNLHLAHLLASSTKPCHANAWATCFSDLQKAVTQKWLGEKGGKWSYTHTHSLKQTNHPLKICPLHQKETIVFQASISQLQTDSFREGNPLLASWCLWKLLREQQFIQDVWNAVSRSKLENIIIFPKYHSEEVKLC